MRVHASRRDVYVPHRPGAPRVGAELSIGRRGRTYRAERPPRGTEVQAALRAVVGGQLSFRCQTPVLAGGGVRRRGVELRDEAGDDLIPSPCVSVNRIFLVGVLRGP